ncbi:hypothetical protein [Paraburkholderia tropica]|uniref:hypothetical protein n=1 Tax=Paraburkholderia tropica TaxID=92647 RepID=UPI0031D742A3
MSTHQVLNDLLLIGLCVPPIFGAVRLAAAFADWLVARRGRTFAPSSTVTIEVPETSPRAFYREPPAVGALPGFDPAPLTADELALFPRMAWPRLRVCWALLADGGYAANRCGNLFRLVGDEWVAVTRESLLDAYDAASKACGLASDARTATTNTSFLTSGLPVLWAVRNAVLWADVRNGRLRAFPCNWLYRKGLNPAPREIDLSDVDAAGNYQPAVHRDDPNDGELGVVRALLFHVQHGQPATPADRHDVRYNRFREAAHAANEARVLRQAGDSVQPEPAADQPAPARKRL